MIYVGGKQKLAGKIVPIMEGYRTSGQFWVEPFVGGGNTICKASGNRLGADINPHTIAALKLIRDEPDKIPKNNKEYTEEMYRKQRLRDPATFSGVESYVGFVATFGALWLDTWAKNAEGVDYVARAYRAAQKQHAELKGVRFENCCYRKLKVPKKSLIYCDPPYKGTTGYRGTNAIDYDDFYKWCSTMADKGHVVFISEFEGPPNWEVIWEQERKIDLCRTGKRTVVERLYICRPA